MEHEQRKRAPGSAPKFNSCAVERYSSQLSGKCVAQLFGALCGDTQRCYCRKWDVGRSCSAKRKCCKDGLVPHWRGLRVVAADASTVRFGLRASHVKGAALADQILFAMFLPGADLTLAASLYRMCDKLSTTSNIS